ncbi:MAG: hypothetical protein P9L99_16595 [Candidatus Lernaella stagnicola]|nr:hypothetical protein [Candidatus Lernaella stagnicola]
MIWAVEGETRYFTNLASLQYVSCAEWGRELRVDPSLISVTPPKEQMELRPNPTFKLGTEASFSVTHDDLRFSAQKVLEGSYCELSVVGYGCDMAQRIVLARGTAQEVQWDEATTVSAKIRFEAEVDQGRIPRSRYCWMPTQKIKPRDVVDYPAVIFSSGGVKRIQLPFAEIKRPTETPDVARIFVIISEQPLPVNVTLADIEVYIPWKGVFESIGTTYVEDAVLVNGGIAGNTESLIEMFEQYMGEQLLVGAGGFDPGEDYSGVIFNCPLPPDTPEPDPGELPLDFEFPEFYFTLDWPRRETDTIPAAIETIMQHYAKVPVPLELDAVAIDTEISELDFEIVINEQGTPLSVVNDRIFAQLQAVGFVNRGTLTVWLLPRELRRGGPHLRRDREILEMAKKPKTTPLEDVVNTVEAFYSRAPQAPRRNREVHFANPVLGGSQLAFTQWAELMERNPLAQAIATYHPTVDAGRLRESRGQFFERRLRIDCPDLTSQISTQQIASRVIEWFSVPAIRVAYRLRPEFLNLRVGHIVMVSDSKWGLNRAPFIVEAITLDVEGPVVELWGGREIASLWHRMPQNENDNDL